MPGILAGGLGTDLVARYPLSVVPTFLVPLAVILHLTGLSMLRAQGRSHVGAAFAPAMPRAAAGTPQRGPFINT